MSRGWIAVDLDGTVAHYDGWKGVHHIGEPIMPMVERIRKWLAEGKDVRIFTARVAQRNAAEYVATVNTIDNWCLRHIGKKLLITNEKDGDMIEQWDDRAVQVIPNTGMRADGVRE